MRKLYFTIALCFVATISFAQAPTGNLTIFSEDGDPFYLVLNGENGYSFNPSDVGEMTYKMSKFVNNPELISEFGQANSI